MDKTRNYKTPGGEHRQNTLQQKSQQDPLWPTSPNFLKLVWTKEKKDTIKKLTRDSYALSLGSEQWTIIIGVVIPQQAQ